MRILFATTNPHKIEEVRAILATRGIEIFGLDSLEEAPREPVEDGETFEENARIKAIAYAQDTGQACLGEDSGLEVDALGGAPGVHSARYSSESGSRDERDRANNQKLLAEMANVPDGERTARFVCAMCFASASGDVLAETRGTYEGEVAHEPRGASGFGYDPLLYLSDVGVTSAELSPDAKNARSHRGDAARRMAALLASLD